MNENNIKALFPEDVETITISKNDYDRLFGELSYKNMILQSKIDKAIEYIEENILDNKIDNVDWDFDDCYYSDMPVARIKPLIDILKEDK